MSEEIRAAALAELAAIESDVFQFGQRVRLFLQSMPADLPQPSAMSPSLSIKGVGGSYLHVMVSTPDEVASWAAWMGATLERKEQHGAMFVSARADVAGLPVYVGCMVLSLAGQQAGGAE